MASMEQDTAEWMEEEETYVVMNEPGSVFLQDPLKLEDPSLHVKQDVELKLDMDGSERKVQVYPSNMHIKEETDDGVNQEFLADPLRVEDPGFHIKEDPELNLDVDGSDHNFVKTPLGITWATDFIKEVPKRASEVDETENVVSSHDPYLLPTE